MKKKFKLIILAISLAITSVVSVGYVDNYFEIAKNLDIFTTLYKELNTFYVDETGIELQSTYRIVYSFLDPWVRAFVLRDITINNQKFDALASTPQLEKDGTTFHFMHQRLQDSIFRKLFN